MSTTHLNKLSYGVKLALAVSTMSITAPAALAQEEADTVEKIEVTGIRASQRENINAKRFSNAVVDAITAEDIGKFPDKNVAESLARIPGITIDRDFGEGQGVSIRGVQPDWNLTLMNGQAVGTSQWFVLTDAARNFNYEILASEMVAGLEVYKSPQADIDEGALGGTVILRTRKPLELDANTAQASVEMQYNDISEETDPSVSGLYSWKNDEDTFGFLVSASIQKRTVQRETNEDFGWFGPTIERIDPLIEAPFGATEKGAVPWGIGSALFEQDRERVGLDVTVQWAPSDKLDMSVHYLHSKMEADNVNSNLIGIPFRGIAFLGTDTNPGSVNNGIVESLQVSGVDNRPGWARHMAYDSIYRDGSEMSTEVLDFEGNYQLENGSIHWQIGTTTGEGQNNDFFTEFWVDATDPRAAFNFTNPGGASPSIDFVGASPWLQNPGDEMWLGGIFDQQNTAEDTEDYLQLDYTLEVELGAINSIKSGAKFRDRAFRQERYKTDLANLSPVGEGSLGPASQFWSGDMVNVGHANTNGVAASYFMPDRDTMYAALYSASECTDGGAGGALCRNSNVLQSLSSFNVEEEITAFYVMANFESEDMRGNIGLRYVQTDVYSAGYDATTGDPGSASGDYSNWLPSINIAYNATEDFILRFAASRVITRPAPFQMAYSVNTTPETSMATAGNPDLEPMTADQFEVSGEWYFGENSLLSAAFFSKSVNNVIFNLTGPGFIGGEPYDNITSPQNGPSTSLDGIELQVQHAFDNGFGGYANITYSDLEDIEFEGETFEFPFSSKDSYNLGVYYETDDYSARLNYNYRAGYFLALTEIGNRYRDEQTQLDAQFSWEVTDYATIKFEALNITDEIWENYYERNTDKQRLGGSQSANGRRFYVGASFKF
ncbi:MAG: TonB-dependent receptor [Aestuariibacter sp.]